MPETLLESFVHRGPSGNALLPLQFDQRTLLRILLGGHPFCDISITPVLNPAPPATALCLYSAELSVYGPPSLPDL